MKIALFILITIGLGFISHAQVDYGSMTIDQLSLMKDNAVKAENYKEAGRCKKAIDLMNELDNAVKTENYDRAAQLKTELSELGKQNELNIEEGNGRSLTNLQELKNVPEISYYNTVVMIENGAVVELEPQTATIKTMSGGFAFYHQSSSFWRIEGKRSNVTLKNNSRLIVRMYSNINPNDILKFAKLDVMGKAEKNRLLPIQTTGVAAVPFGASVKTDKHDDNYIGIKFKQLDDNYYEIMFEDILIPGEYAFITGNKMSAFSVKDCYSNNGIKPNISKIGPEEIYTIPTLSYYGIDFSKFTYVATSKSVSLEKSLVQNWYEQNKNRQSVNRMEGWFKKSSIIDYSEEALSLFLNHSDREFISDIPNPLSYSDIQNILNEYPKGQGLGLIYVVENMYHEQEKIEGFFVWFDCETKAIVNINYFKGNGARIDKWGDIFVDLIAYYADRKFIPVWESYR